MKRSFTLIEVLITTSIIMILSSMILPYYNNYILKSRFEEAKLMIHKISLAQERFKTLNGVYYDKYGTKVTNENKISNDLNINLNTSNNFIYGIEVSEDKSNYIVIASLRFTKNTTCDDDELICKQLLTLPRDKWVDAYITKENNHYLSFSYPSKFINGSNFNYSHIYDEI